MAAGTLIISKNYGDLKLVRIQILINKKQQQGLATCGALSGGPQISFKCTHKCNYSKHCRPRPARNASEALLCISAAACVTLYVGLQRNVFVLYFGTIH
jgi:hypothetical protein